MGNETIDLIKRDYKNLLETCEQEYCVNSVCTEYNFEKWQKNKSFLINLFSQSRNWDEKRFCIHSVRETVKKISISSLRKLNYNLFNNYSRYSEVWEVAMAIATLKDAFDHPTDYPNLKVESIVKIGVYKDIENIRVEDLQYTDETALFYILNKIGVRSKEIKFSKLFCKMCDLLNTYRPNLIGEVEKAKITDDISSKKIKRGFITSLNPCDYLTQSHGNSWTSCHSLESCGCYHSGVLTGMVDATTIIAYTISLEEYEEALEDGSQFYNIRKEFRETIYMNEDVAVICRRYPSGRTYPETLKLLLKELSLDWEEFDKKPKFDDTYNMGYNDYNCCDTYQYSRDGFSNHRIEIGQEAFSVDIPKDYITSTSTLYSEESAKEFCDHCETYADEDDGEYVQNYGFVCQICLNENDRFYRCYGDGYWYNDRIDDYIIISGYKYNQDYANRHLNYVMEEITGEYVYSDCCFSFYDDNGDDYNIGDFENLKDFIYDLITVDEVSFENYTSGKNENDDIVIIINNILKEIEKKDE